MLLKLNFGSTVWKLQDFSATQILREIKFSNFGVSKIAILPYLVAQNLDIFEFLALSNVLIFTKNQNRASKMANIVVIELLKLPYLISRKI